MSCCFYSVSKIKLNMAVLGNLGTSEVFQDKYQTHKVKLVLVKRVIHLRTISFLLWE